MLAQKAALSRVASPSPPPTPPRSSSPVPSRAFTHSSSSSSTEDDGDVKDAEGSEDEEDSEDSDGSSDAQDSPAPARLRSAKTPQRSRAVSPSSDSARYEWHAQPTADEPPVFADDTASTDQFSHSAKVPERYAGMCCILGKRRRGEHAAPEEEQEVEVEYLRWHKKWRKSLPESKPRAPLAQAVEAPLAQVVERVQAASWSAVGEYEVYESEGEDEDGSEEEDSEDEEQALRAATNAARAAAYANAGAAFGAPYSL